MNLHSIICKTLGPGIHSLIFVALFTGCANSSGPPVDLPVAKHAPAAMKHGRDTLVVTCTADRKVWMGGEIATNEGLNARLHSLRKKYESFTTVIRADRTTKLADILALYRICSTRFEDRCVISVEGADAAIESEIPFISYRVNDHGSYMFICRLEHATNGMSFNGHVITNERVCELLMQVANIDKGLLIRMAAHPDDPIQNAIEGMDLCHKAGLSHIFLVETGLD